MLEGPPEFAELGQLFTACPWAWHRPGPHGMQLLAATAMMAGPSSCPD